MNYLATLLLIFTLSKSAFGGEQLTLSPYGYGEIRFGERLSAIESRLKESAYPKKRESACDFVKFRKYPGLKFMVEDGLITRADASDKVPNSIGISVGDSIANLKMRVPNARIEPHKYDETGHYIIVSSEDKKYAIVFEASRKIITDVRSGLEPSVEYVEGCL